MQGTFVVCSNCKQNKNCCSDFQNIDNPIISNAEYETIKNHTNCPDSCFENISEDAYIIKNQDGKCPFYNNGCSIYEIRPNDCRLYPYDIKKIDGDYYLVKYKLKCLNGDTVDEKVDEIINNIKPYISTYTDKLYNEKLNSYKYDIVEKITF